MQGNVSTSEIIEGINQLKKVFASGLDEASAKIKEIYDVVYSTDSLNSERIDVIFNSIKGKIDSIQSSLDNLSGSIASDMGVSQETIDSSLNSVSSYMENSLHY